MSAIFLGCLGCCGLVLAPGLLVTRMQVKKTGQKLELGQGAAMGFVTGAIFSIVFTSMDFVWLLLSVDVNALYFESMIALMEEAGNEQAVQQMEEMQEETQDAGGFSILNVLMSMLVIGLLNMLTGMAGSGLFKGKDDAAYG
ncbi:MAG: hypothetical protein ACOC2C_03635 [Cyclonatronaceae bacterium]